MSKKIALAGPVLIIIAALLWALDGVIRRGLYSFEPIHIIFFEHAIGFLILLPFALPALRKSSFTKKEWGVLALVSLLSGLLGTLFFTTALLKTMFISFSVVFLLQKLQPLFAIATARIFLKEPLPPRYIRLALCALLAAYFVTFPLGKVNFETGAGTAMAALFALLAAIAWAISTTFSKIALANHNPRAVTFIRFAITTTLAFLAIVIFSKVDTLRAPTGGEFIRFLIIALSTGMVALLIYYKGLKTTPVRVSTILELTFPFVAIMIDVFLYKSVLHWSQYVAAALLLFVMYRITKLQNKHAI